MKQSFQNTRYRAILLLTGLMLAMTTMAQTLTNDALDLSGMWRFQLDPMGFGKTPGSSAQEVKIASVAGGFPSSQTFMEIKTSLTKCRKN